LNRKRERERERERERKRKRKRKRERERERERRRERKKFVSRELEYLWQVVTVPPSLIDPSSQYTQLCPARRSPGLHGATNNSISLLFLILK
jgi:hypothetical protein